MTNYPKVPPPAKTLNEILAETNELLAQARQELTRSNAELGAFKKINSALDSFRKP
jgi:light-regulated signal transduction histidine kinase (bacteriophytochrome)